MRAALGDLGGTDFEGVLGCELLFLRGVLWGSPKASHIKASHPHFPHFPRFRVRIFRVFRVFRVFALRNLLRPLFFWGERDFPHFPRFSPYRFRIADFENPTDRL